MKRLLVTGGVGFIGSSFVRMVLEEQSDGTLLPIPGSGAQVRLSRDILLRQGPLLSSVVSVRHWQDGRARDITPEELRDGLCLLPEGLPEGQIPLTGSYRVGRLRDHPSCPPVDAFLFSLVRNCRSVDYKGLERLY